MMRSNFFRPCGFSNANKSLKSELTNSFVCFISGESLMDCKKYVVRSAAFLYKSQAILFSRHEKNPRTRQIKT